MSAIPCFSVYAQPSTPLENLTSAANTGDLYRTEILMSVHTYSEDDIIRALHSARNSDRANIVLHMLKNISQTPTFYRLDTLKYAIKNNRPKTMNSLLKTVRISENRVFKELKGAEKFLLKTNVIQKFSSTHGRLKAFRQYFRSGEKLDKFWKENLTTAAQEALVQAATNNDLPHMQLLIKKFEYSKNDKQDALNAALTKDHDKIVTYLLKNSFFDRGETLIYAATSGSLKSVWALLNTHKAAKQGLIYNLLRPFWKFLLKKRVVLKCSRTYFKLRDFKNYFANGKIPRFRRKKALDCIPSSHPYGDRIRSVIQANLPQKPS